MPYRCSPAHLLAARVKLTLNCICRQREATKGRMSGTNVRRPTAARRCSLPAETQRTTSNSAATPRPPPTDAAATPKVPEGAPPRTRRLNSRTTATAPLAPQG